MEVRERVAKALACAALDPGLAGVLLLDLDPALAAPLGEWLAALLPGQNRPRVLPSDTTDDDLWVSVRPSAGGGGGFRPVPGPLLAAGRRAAVVVVPDLSRSSLATSQAAVMTLTAAVAHLERDSRSDTWTPADRWVTGCPTDRTARLSRHLLDRFGLRIDATGLTPVSDGRTVLNDPPDAWRQTVRAAHEGGPLPPFSATAADRVLVLLPASASGTRRDLFLGRTARALALLSGAASTEAHHVDEAAALTGLRHPAASQAPRVDGPPPLDGRALLEEPPPTARIPRQVRVGTDGPAVLPSQPLPPQVAWPYPEDMLLDEREAAPLRPPHHRSAAKALRGLPIGTTTATSTRDLSLTATAREAAKYQALRCPAHHLDGTHPLHLTAADLRAHRRAAESSRLLVILLDHTSRRGLDWFPVLSPYLNWAYTSRSRVAVVEVGAGDSPSELAASLCVCRSLLDRRIVQALARPAGRATPLAHGLHLAGALLRHETQHGGALVDDALLLVFTDGRANVPLDASLTLRTPTAVGDRGVRDAWEQARRIARLPRVSSLVLHPGPRPQEHLVARLAEELGGEVIAVDRVETDAA
ncbi:hypothetical protein ACFVXW_16710 [Streptomyces sp. NPDC058251]|uniref:hypothetical protein n=1 Tax=Streptomyces sp. NPDC058251 TaxID=3346404 RepID=UPI0036E440E1